MPRRRHERSRSAHDSVASRNPVSKGDEFLLPISADPDRDHQAHFVLIETDLETDAVNSHVHVVGIREGAFIERGGLVLPQGASTG